MRGNTQHTFLTRHSGKAVVNRTSTILCALAAGLVVAFALGGSAAGGSIPRFLTDSRTGFAASGYDPVAYFADGAARPGSAEFEAFWADAAWRFANPGNRAAFLAAPEVYAPAFAGHCALAVSRGHPAEGDPTIWAVHDDRLYFFHSKAHREIFLHDPDTVIAEAEAWLSRTQGAGPRR